MDENEKQDGEGTREEQPSPGSAEAMKILKDIQEKLDGKPAEKTTEKEDEAPDPEKELERESKRTGMTKEALRRQDERIALAQAPIIERQAWDSMERGHKDLSEYRDEVKKELENYQPVYRTPELIEKLFWMVKGRSVDKRGSAAPVPQPKPKERISGGYSGSEASLSGGGSGDRDTEPKLSDEEKEVVDRLGSAAAPLGCDLDEKGYERAKKSRKIGQFKTTPQIDMKTGNTADRALGNLLGIRK